MADKYHQLPPILHGYVSAQAVTPNSAEDLPTVARALWIGTTGNLKVLFRDDEDGKEVLISNVPVGLFPFYVRRVFDSTDGTTAADIIALQ